MMQADDRRERVIKGVLRMNPDTTREEAAYVYDPSVGTIQCHDDRWVTACGGTETPFTTRSGYRLLYMWQPSTGKHAYLNLDTDIILTDQEAFEALGVQ